MKNLILLTLLSLMLTVSTPVSSQVSTVDSIQLATVKESGITEGTVKESETPQNQVVPPLETTEQIQVQTPAPVQNVSFFGKLWNNAKESGVWVLVMYVAGILSKNGITKVVKAIAGKGTIITKELSDVALASSNFLSLLDKAIKADGTVVQDSLKQAVDAGKTVIAETKESWITIKPKPVVEVPAG